MDIELVTAMAHLIPQLAPSAPRPDAERLRAIVESSGTTLLVARDQHGAIIGTLSLAILKLPTAIRACIEDVVVEEQARGQGVGEALTRHALKLAAEQGAHTVDLTARPAREAANRLYQRIGFATRETNMYRYQPDRDAKGD